MKHGFTGFQMGKGERLMLGLVSLMEMGNLEIWEKK